MDFGRWKSSIFYLAFRGVKENKQMKSYKNYVFDLYGTLVDIRTDEEKRSLWEKMSLFLGYYGAVYTPEEMQKTYHNLVQAEEATMVQDMPPADAHEAHPEIPIENVFQQLYRIKGTEPSMELVCHTGQMFRVLSTHHVKLYAGAEELLSSLKKAGKKVYLLSNAQRIFTEYELFYLKIHDCFDGILISSSCGVKKPDERFFRILLERYQIKPEESLMIGNDLTTDIKGAKQAGMDAYYIHSAISPKSNEEMNADYYMPHMNLRSLQKQLLEG